MQDYEQNYLKIAYNGHSARPVPQKREQIQLSFLLLPENIVFTS